MKSALFILAITLFSFTQSSALAQAPTSSSPEAIARAFLKNTLNVHIADSCELIEAPVAESHDPYKKTDMCVDKDLQGLTELKGRVYRVVDGDTIHFFAHNKLYAIRMLGMDTPELHYLSKSQPKWGEKAKASLLEMVKPNDEILLELDQVRCDRYGRVLGHVFKDGLNLNFEQVRKGLAVNYCIAPNMKHCSAYSLAYLKADQEGIGMHRDECLVTPYVWRRGLGGEEMNKKVKDSRTNKIYEPKDYYLVPVAYRIFYP